MSDQKAIVEVKPKKRVFKPKVIILDVDDTILDFCGFLCSLHNKKYGTCISPNDLTDWNFSSVEVKDANGNVVLGSQLRATFEEYEADGLYVGLDVLGDADFALEIMKKLGYKIILLTARNEKFGKQTELNLIMNKIYQFIDEIHFKSDKNIENFKTNKIKELSKIYNIQLFADDRAETVMQISENCKVDKIFLINKAHNKNIEIEDENIVRVGDLMEAVRYLKKIGK
jgi:hypothetical protein